MIRSEKRKNRRKAMRHAAWIGADGAKPHGCVVADISATGARLNIESPEMVPETFTLLLSARGLPRRRCRTVWRAAGQIGVRFEKPGG